MNSTDNDDGDIQSGGPTTTIRLYLRCSNLPKKAIINQQPDTIARVSLLQGSNSSSNHTQLPPPIPPPSATSNNVKDDDTYSLIDETEVVQRSSNPRYTTTFTTSYEYGSSLLFFIDIFELRSNITTTSKKMKLLGRAVFDVQDVLGSRNNVKARRLRKGGVVYAHIEIEQQQQHTPPSPTRSLSSSITSSTRGRDTAPDSQMLVLRLQADSLIHTHSNLSKVISTKHITKPDTYIEISRPSFGGTWIVVYRSPPIKESVSPLYDESIIDLSSFATTVSASPNNIKVATTIKDDVMIMSSPILIIVYKVKRKKCKEIGSFETTIQSLIEHSTHNDGYIQELEYNGMSESGEEVVANDQKKIFHLRPTGKRGENQSYEITGSVTVVTAKIQNSNELQSSRYSQRFLSNVDENDIEVTGGGTSKCEMTDGDTLSSRSISSFIAVPPQARPKFNEYVKSGMVDVDLCVAIDFTSSNGDPRIPGTQHFSRDGLMNDYEESIVAIGETISKYSSSQDYPVWGFGAKFAGETRHIFQLGNSSTAHGVEGILDAYRTVWETDLIMSGPTVLHSVLRAAASRAKKFYNAPVSKTNDKYCILLILTDGIVQDLNSTQELVRTYSSLGLPLSVIVIGIGRADFSDFKQWSNSPSLDTCGRFTFVEFREYQFDPEELSRQALVKVPQDIVDYYLSRDILPS